jgi:starch phosphorylase
VESGAASTLSDAIVQAAPRLAFTTHTPVAAGHDAFPSDLVEAYFAGYREQLGLSHEQFMAFGRRNPFDSSEGFSMTVLALHSAGRRNAVSQLHGVVSREMWGGIGLGLTGDPPQGEMDAITNGVHTATWVGPEMSALFDRQLGRTWREEPDVPAAWRWFAGVDPEPLWSARTAQRARLLERVDAMARTAGLGGLAEGITADRALIVGFARRFATYKRAALLLADPDRLARLLGDPDRPVVLVFAGKAHPRDEPGKALMQRIVHAARDDRFRGRLVFLENYDVEIARLLVQGSDIWLNTPRRPQEASGTSGMKAVLNGALHLSELDGWWDEAYQSGLGWGLGLGFPDSMPEDERDVAEARQLMELLEREIAPLFFSRDDQGCPREWLGWAERSVRTLAPAFSAQRMVSEYAERVYLPAAEASAPARGAVPSMPSAPVSPAGPLAAG